MRHLPESALIGAQQLKRTFTYDGVLVLTLGVDYPVVKVPGSRRAERRINETYLAQMQKYYARAAGPLYQDAVSDYLYAREMGHPFNPYELTVKYAVSLNGGCHLSGFHDCYEFTGGANGTTRRASDTFSLFTGCRIKLASLFSCGQDWQNRLKGEVLRQADINMRLNPSLYYDNYRGLILAYFKPENFYLTPVGITIYYQPDEIGPAVDGVVSFTVPYEQVGAKVPSCSCSGAVLAAAENQAAAANQSVAGVQSPGANQGAAANGVRQK